MSDDNLDVGGGRSIELLPENVSIGRELMPGDAIAQIGEKTGLNDRHVKEMFPAMNNFKGRVVFENIKDEQEKVIGVFVIGIENGEEVFRYKILYVNGKFVKSD